jgi:hypothetical protein
MTFNFKYSAAVIAAVAAAGIGAAACTGGSATKVSNGPPPTTSAPVHHSAKPAPLTGPVGSTFKVSGTDGNDNLTKYKVELVKWLPVAAPDNSFDAAPAGHFLTAAEIKLVGVSGDSQGDADNSLQMISTSGHVADSNFGNVAAGTDFNSGSFNVAAGETEVGYVSFVVPNSQQINRIQWSDSGFFGGPIVTWKVTP